MSRGIASLRGYQEGGSTSLTIQDEPSWAALGMPEGAIGTPLSPQEFAKLTPQQKLDHLILAKFNKTLPLRQLIADSGEEAARQAVADELLDPFLKRAALDPSEVTQLRRPYYVGSDYYPYRTGASLSTKNAVLENLLSDDMRRSITIDDILAARDDPMFGAPLSDQATDLELKERIYARRFADRYLERYPRNMVLEDMVSDLDLEPGTDRVALQRELERLKGVSPPNVDPVVIPAKTPLLTRGTQAAKNVGIRTLKTIRNKLPMVLAGAATAPVLPLKLFELAADLAVSPTGMGSGTPDWRRSEGLQDRPFGEDIYRSPEELEASGRYRATQLEQLEDFLPYTGARLPTGRRVGPVRPR